MARNAFDGVEVLDGKIYFVGGYDGSEASKNIAERYDPATNQWETLTPMSVAREGLAAAVLDGKLYAIGEPRSFQRGDLRSCRRANGRRAPLCRVR